MKNYIISRSDLKEEHKIGSDINYDIPKYCGLLNGVGDWNSLGTGDVYSIYLVTGNLLYDPKNNTFLVTSYKLLYSGSYIGLGRYTSSIYFCSDEILRNWFIHTTLAGQFLLTTSPDERSFIGLNKMIDDMISGERDRRK